MKIKVIKNEKTPTTHCVIFMVLYKCKHRRDFMIISYWSKFHVPAFDDQFIYLQKQHTQQFRV